MTEIQNDRPADLTDAAVAYLGSLSSGKREAVTPAVMNFVRWYGAHQSIDKIAPPKLGEYAESQPSGEDGAAKIKAVREMLAYAARQNWISSEMSGHLKVRKVVARVRSANSRPAVEKLVLTTEKQAEMTAELTGLKERRVHVIDDIKRAAADKDLKENAPYHAAREEKARLDGKIKELETLLKHAVIGEQECAAGTVADLGRKVTLKETASGAQRTYLLVTPREVNPKTGRISPVSPIGKAIMGRSAGEIVEVVAPACTVKYLIECIE
ncbi:transcription elongation factor GreA [Dehalogenimonas alkenigignens]|uniref:Transcription elongation factor GreA n=1 Tax=Dehalogenimonas alkenigignens TaxID=1217799 RepID=A0A0W0GIV0_9CHLR|nr:transcription elongation factor GreA [Dehalogenimonas alkenigignens]KTB48462.1 Transcription elongation factor [Dehalogenimonas alkenigignens]PVV85087.1 transcription elongation factor GreA [Dehalogenimonas alkenigignens]